MLLWNYCYVVFSILVHDDAYTCLSVLASESGADPAGYQGSQDPSNARERGSLTPLVP